MTDPKEILVNTIKEWVLINSKMNELQKTIKDLRLKKKNLSSILIDIMQNNEIDGIDINNGKLVYKKTKVKAQINKDYLLKILGNYFDKYPEIDIDDVGSFILDNRPIKETDNLIIKQNK
tara:strand:+ start:2164 stop:2523 length:360 start_codon:yes stop_codon:yes gene_type:complete